MALLHIRNLTVAFQQGTPALPAVQDVSLALAQGEIVGVVGESRSGKSVIALSIARLLATPPASYLRGQIILDGHQILTLPPKALRQIRGRLVGYVFPNPAAFLNPLRSIESQIRETLRCHHPDNSARKHALQLLDQVQIHNPQQCLRHYPHQLSLAVQQRVMIAIAIAPRPKLLVADEPTAALDPSLRHPILNLLRDLRAQLGLGILFLTRNPALVCPVADQIAVLAGGQIVELGPTNTILRDPMHPHTRSLLHSIPTLRTNPPRPTANPL
jgi:ABC-type dipeptide/oligopeptide/nickel transport system ATPase component